MFGVSLVKECTSRGIKVQYFPFHILVYVDAFSLTNYYIYEFDLRVSLHRGLLNKIPTRCSKSSLFFFVFCCTVFGRYIHPSSGTSTVQAGMV
jgi:hypothetical protein